MARRLFMCVAAAVLLGAGSSAQAAGLEWLTDYPKALAKARAENKLVLLDFTGSDFCIACKQLKQEVLPQKVFVEYAAKELILVEVDFPLKKPLPKSQSEANEALKEQFKVDGYPTLILVDAHGRKLGEINFDQDAEGLVRSIKELKSKATR